MFLTILTWVIAGLLLVIIALVVWFKWQTRSRRPKEEGYKYVYVMHDGSAREVDAEDRDYLETEFHGADGGRPYIKFRYESLDGRGNIQGFLERRQLPAHIEIVSADSVLSEEYKAFRDRNKRGSSSK